jgi:5-methylcytosine-specific restriction endonuclease McrA
MLENIQQLSLLTPTDGKTCKQCGEWKPLTKFLKGGYVGGRSPRCRNCTDPPENQRARDRRRYREPKRNAEVRERVRRWTQENAAHAKEGQRRRYEAKREQHLITFRQRYHDNKDVYAARARRYRADNKDAIKASRVRYKTENADKIRESQRESYERHKESRRAKYKTYRKLHPEVKQVSEARRYARKKGARGNFGVRQWRAICAAYGHLCLACKAHKPLTVDHVIPISKDGFDCVCNIQPLCLQCNVKKNVRTVDHRPFLVALPCPHREAE